MNRFFVPKLEGDYSDILITIGISTILDFIFESNQIEPRQITIKNQGSFYLIEANKTIKSEYFNNVKFKSLYPVIFYDKMEKKPDYTSNIIDFTTEKKYEDWSVDERKSNLIKQTTGIPVSNKIMNDILSIKSNFSDILFTVLTFYSNIQKDYNMLDKELDALFEKIQINMFKDFVKSRLMNQQLSIIEEDLDILFNSFDNYHWSKRNKVKKFLKEKLDNSEASNEIIDDIEEFYNQAKIDFSNNHTALSCLLPVRVKGLNMRDLSSDARITPSNNTENWVKLFLIIIGFYKIFILKHMTSGNRLYSVIEPNQISFNKIDELYQSIKSEFYPAETLEKQNILYISDFIIKLLDKLSEFNTQTERRSKRNRLKNYIKGLKNAYLVDMGQNHVVKNIYDLNIPNWIYLDEEKDKDKFKEIFGEFKELIQPIDDKNEDIKIFQELYMFLTTERVDYLLNYYYHHALLAMQRLSNDKGARIYKKRSVEFIMSKLESNSNIRYITILKNDGFKNFSKAIRNSTLVPIYLNEKKKVKFGLLQELRRASLNKDTLITKISEFMANYNNENGLESFHQGHQKRANLTTADFEQVVKLVDEYDPKIIGNMMLAYGFGKDEKVEEIKEDGDNE